MVRLFSLFLWILHSKLFVNIQLRHFWQQKMLTLLYLVTSFTNNNYTHTCLEFKINWKSVQNSFRNSLIHDFNQNFIQKSSFRGFSLDFLRNSFFKFFCSFAQNFYRNISQSSSIIISFFSRRFAGESLHGNLQISSGNIRDFFPQLLRDAFKMNPNSFNNFS